MNSAVNVIIGRFLVIVFAATVVVAILTYSEIFLITLKQMYLLLLSAAPCALGGFLVLIRKNIRNDSRAKYVLCILMCFQAFALALAGYSYIGKVILLLPIFLASLYPKSRLNSIVLVVMLICGFIVPPLALVAGFWDGGYFEFLYDLTNGRQMDTATLSDAMLTMQEQVVSAIRFCSAQNILIIGGFGIIGRLIYRQTNRSFENQKDVIRLSETDELTGLLNRNCFERRLDELEAVRNHRTVCFYFDVNGLHEMNNQHGHKAGDIMLQFVGKTIQDEFGEYNTFRIGGDEYVAFSMSHDREPLSAVKESLEKQFATRGYHVSIGYAQSNTITNVNELVQLAEGEMYLAKSRYYIEHDRRR